MKTQFMFLLIFILGLAACSSNSDFAIPVTGDNVSAEPGILATIDDIQGLIVCMDVQSTHMLAGSGRLSGSSFSGFAGPFGTYYISASGTAISDPLKDGNSLLMMQYSPNTGMVSGALTTQYSSGAKLDQKFEGLAQRQINGKTMTLTMALSSALLTMDPDQSILSAGTITLVMPTYPMGNFQIHMETKGTYCTED